MGRGMHNLKISFDDFVIMAYRRGYSLRLWATADNDVAFHAVDMRVQWREPGNPASAVGRFSGWYDRTKKRVVVMRGCGDSARAITAR